MLGVQHLKESEDVLLPPEQQYVRVVEEQILEHSSEPEDVADRHVPFRIIICMSAESSRCLQQAQFLQSDIGFKRIVGFEEFEIGHLDPGSQTSESLASCLCLISSV